jgi:AraC-like DNA-binding protein
MQPDFKLPGQEHTRISPMLPEAYRGLALRGGEVAAAAGDWGQMIIQALPKPSFSIQFNLFEFVRPMIVAGHQAASTLVSVLALKNNIQYTINGLGTLRLRQGQFALLHCREHSLTARFDGGKEYQTLEIGWSEDILRQALPYFNLLQRVFSPPPGVNSFYLVPPGRSVGPDALSIAQDVLKSPYNATLSQLFFEHKVREYLLLLLLEAGKMPAPHIRLTKGEWEKVEAVAAKITSEPDKKFPIVDLAADAHMNTLKLKTAFKEKFGQGIFEYQLAARMNEALRLLRETDLKTKVIAGLVGYELTTSFITKFREYFGYAPSEVAKNK